MNPRNIRLVFLLIFVTLSVHSAFTHAPDKPTDNESLPTAYTIVTLVIGFAILVLKRPTTLRTLFGGIGVFAGLPYLGSGFMTLTQMILAVTTAAADLSAVLTAVSIIIPILLAIAIFRLTINRKQITYRSRVFAAMTGVLGLFAWAGLIVGPIFALLTSLLPIKLHS